MSRFVVSLLALVALCGCGGLALVDRDGDQVADDDDSCPADSEDFDGFEDDDGCPEPDNDQDRILDRDDACPLEPENFNGFEDEDGCRDHGIRRVDDGILYIEQHVTFAFGSSEVSAGSIPLIEATVATLQGNPQIERAVCLGRAARGERLSYSLSVARAEAACGMLVERGIDPARLRAYGVGTIDPLTEAEDYEPDRERSAAFEILVVDGMQTHRWNGRTLVEIPPVDVTERGEVSIVENIDVIFDRVYFLPNSAEVREVSEPIVEALAEGMRLSHTLELMACVGHAARGERDPLALSQARADAVCERLAALGIDSVRLESHGAGTAMPISGRGTGRRYDAERERRVELMGLIEAGVVHYRWNGTAIEVASTSSTADP